MTRSERLYRWLGWFLALCGSAGIAYVFCGCTGSEKAIARAAVDVIQALCSPTATVQECADTILASLPDVDAGTD